jgi:hypothetical protein
MASLRAHFLVSKVDLANTRGMRDTIFFFETRQTPQQKQLLLQKHNPAPVVEFPQRNSDHLANAYPQPMFFSRVASHSESEYKVD